jgi:hypothetical protein
MLQDFFSKKTDRFRVWTSGGFKYAKRHRQKWTTATSPCGSVGQGAQRPMVSLPSSPSPARSVFVLRLGKIEVSVFVLSNSENIFYVALLKHKIAENRELALWHLVNRLVPENA